MAYLEALLLTAVILFLFYSWLKPKYRVLEGRGVPHKKPKLLLGNLDLKLLLGRSSVIKVTIDGYLQNKHNKIYGTYNLLEPIIIVRDPELIKKVGIKDCEYFLNHRKGFGGQEDSVLSKSLIALQDRKWKEMRNTLTPSFTGNKMRLMFELINECCIEGVKYIDVLRQSTGNSELEIEMKDYFTRYTNDVIASAAFGIKVNSFKNKNNEFFTTGKDVTQFTVWAIIKTLLYNCLPKLMKALGVSVFNEKKMKYFTRLIYEAMDYRRQHHIIRPDMINLLMEAKRRFDETESSPSGQHAEFSDEDLLAQCMLFFFAGFETVSSCLCLTTWELLWNSQFQDRLYEEIVETELQLDGKPVSYDVLMKMKYMDMVLSESLRKWPPAIMTDRLCTADYEFKNEDGSVIARAKKGDILFIPIAGLHHDPEYFPDPSSFDPERFSEENKHRINPSTYLPFGIGPRNCIGNRLALMETKAILYHLLLKYKLAPAKKTCKDLMSEMRGFQLQPPNLFPVKLIPRVA